MSHPIPRPRKLPVIGNALSIDRELPARSFRLMAQQYGEVYRIDILGETTIIVNTQELTQEVLSDEKRFRKEIKPPLSELRDLVGDALFTAHHDEPNWAIAHRILMPAFGPASIRGMFEPMQDVVQQMVLKWERFGPNHPINPMEDFTRLAFDAIALCTMDYRLNSFYDPSMPAFINAMGDWLIESFLRSFRPGIVQALMRGSNAKYQKDMNLMRDLCRKVIEYRKSHPAEKHDLLNMMLSGRDPVKGQGLSDDNIMKQLLTFFIAGHETSSGMLSFTMYHLLKNPAAYERLQAEVDSVTQGEPIRLEHLAKMPYLNAVMRESIRLDPPIQGFGVVATDHTTIGGKYKIKKGWGVLLSAVHVQRDPKVWGADADLFRPERMLDGAFEALPDKSWIPFGSGMRGCIGRAFAWQEVSLTLASLFQHFDFRMTNPGYTLELKQTMTVKPRDFGMYASPRKDAPRATLQASEPRLNGTKTVSSKGVLAPSAGPNARHRIHVLHGGNTGSCESFAKNFAANAHSRGFEVTLGTLDSVRKNLPTDGPVIIIAASFEGQPADNARHFVESLAHGSKEFYAGVRYAVFGCGNREWVQTYQKIPRVIDTSLEDLGGSRILERGEADASGADFFESFDEWEVRIWSVLDEKSRNIKGTGSAELDVKLLGGGTDRATRLRQTDVQLGSVIENQVLTAPGAPVKRHLEFELPKTMTYRAGDYLAILPRNPDIYVQRAMSRLQLSSEQQIEIASSLPTTLPTDQPISVKEILTGYIELAQPATKKNIQALIDLKSSETTRRNLAELVDSYAVKILEMRTSILDILVKYPGIEISLAQFLTMLPPMRVRQYSISSSPLWNSNRVTLTVSILDAPSLANADHVFLGVASTFLADLHAGDKVQMAVRSSGAAFHPPTDPSTPLVMFAAGSGIAPFRGFLQDRAVQKSSGRDVTQSLLFIGCRKPEVDFLYGDRELEEWRKQGIVDVRPAFSQALEKSEGCRYVQDRVWHDRDDILRAYESGAKFFTCGTSRAANGIKDACVRILQQKDSVTRGEAQKTFERLQRERFATDIFG